RVSKKSAGLFRTFGENDRSGNPGDLDLDFLSRLCIRHVHDVPAHLHDPVPPFGDRLDLDIQYLAFLEVFRDGLGAGLAFPDRAVAPAGIAAEDHDPVVLDEPCIRLAAFGTDHVVVYVTLDDGLDEGYLELPVENGAVPVDLPACPEFPQQKFHQVVLVTAYFSYDFGKIFQHGRLSLDVGLRLGNDKTLGGFGLLSDIGIGLFEKIFVRVRHNCIQ